MSEQPINPLQESVQPEETNTASSGELNPVRLKDIHLRATKKYEGKYPSALFGVNFELDEHDLREVEMLAKRVKESLDSLVKAEPLWMKFVTLLQERRKKVGHLAEESSIVEDPATPDVEKEMIDGRTAIKVPPRIRHLYIWSRRVRDVLEDVEGYRNGVSKGTRAVSFGEKIKELYRFLKETDLR